tara:strand:- start:4635 stop:5210 length:576 start_codon:yes stop_codon:yes gene_type:complete
MSDLTITTGGISESIVSGNRRSGAIVRVKPTLLTAQTDDDDVMFNATEIPNAVRTQGGLSKLRGITVLDNNQRSAAMNIFFMQVQTNFGAQGSNPNITDANLSVAKVIGAIDWAHTDGQCVISQDSGSASISTSMGQSDNSTWRSLPMLLQAEDNSTSVYFTATLNMADNSNKTYPAVDTLEFIFHIEYLD